MPLQPTLWSTQSKNFIWISKFKECKGSLSIGFFRPRVARSFMHSTLGRPSPITRKWVSSKNIRNFTLTWNHSTKRGSKPFIWPSLTVKMTETSWKSSQFWNFFRWPLSASEDSIIDGPGSQKKSILYSKSIKLYKPLSQLKELLPINTKLFSKMSEPTESRYQLLTSWLLPQGELPKTTSAFGDRKSNSSTLSEVWTNKVKNWP